ncbi:hypothetical protein [Parasitella parasitica]|uniref:Uncharacterized protein n=1 Tax=Parasitella parasitica TaxID=35722 RepID=A0A0B7NFN7_9FUNG|nr:hypothetical protein [Parasitella parasitica]
MSSPADSSDSHGSPSLSDSRKLTIETKSGLIILEAPENLEQMNISPNTIKGVSNIINEDVKMEDVQDPSPAKNKKIPADVLKKILYSRDQFVSLYTDIITLDSTVQKDINHINEFREKIEGLQKNISLMRNTIRLSNEKVTASLESSKTIATGQVLPSTSQKMNHMHLCEDIEGVWKVYMPLTLPYELDTWLNNEVLACKTWHDVGVVFNKKFGNNAVLKLQSRREVFNAKMRPGESTEENTIRFSKAATDVYYSLDNTTIGDAFLTGFPEEWQTQIRTVLHCNHSDRDYWTIDEIHTAALNIYSSKPAPISFVNKSRAAISGNDTNQQNKRFKSSTEESPPFFCPNHGGAATRHYEKDCYGNKKMIPTSGSSTGRVSKPGHSKPTNFLGNKNVPRKSTNNTLCNWCGKLWFFGHVCHEYDEKKHGSNASVLTIKSASNQTKKKSKGKKAIDAEKLFRKNMENDSYCEYINKHTNEENNLKLIAPLLLDNTRVLGKIEPGAAKSFINNKSILNKDFTDVKNENYGLSQFFICQ